MTPIQKALAELEDTDNRAKKWADKEYDPEKFKGPFKHHDIRYTYARGAASMLPAVEAVKVLVEAMEKIGHTQDVSPADSETGGPCRIAVANSRNRRILEAQEALRVAARILGGRK